MEGRGRESKEGRGGEGSDIKGVIDELISPEITCSSQDISWGTTVAGVLSLVYVYEGAGSLTP